MPRNRMHPRAKPPEPQPPKRKLLQYERRSRLKRSDLSPLENPLPPEERTPELTAIYRRAADTVDPAELDRLCTEVEMLLSKEEKSGGVPRCIYQQPRISFEQLAQELGFSTREALGLLEGRPTARREPLSGDCRIEGQEILDLQSAIVEAKLGALPEMPAARKGSHSVAPVVVAAERDAPSQLMDFDALSALYSDWAGQRKALKERHNAAAAPYRRTLSDPNPPKIYPRWVNKYTAMDKLLRQRKEEIRSSQKAKSEYWQERILDRWKASHPLPGKEEMGPLRALPSSGKLAFGLRVITLFLFQLFFSCCNWLNVDLRGTRQIKEHLIAEFRAVPEVPDLLTYNGVSLITFGLFLGMAFVCCLVFHRCCGTSMRRMASWVTAAFVIFFLLNTLLYPLIPLGDTSYFSYFLTSNFSCFLVAPVATLIHIVIAIPSRAASPGSGSKGGGSRAGALFDALLAPVCSGFGTVYSPLNTVAKLLSFVLFWVVQFYFSLRAAVVILGRGDGESLLFPFDCLETLGDYSFAIVLALLILSGVIALVPDLRTLFLDGPELYDEDDNFLQMTESMLMAYSGVLLAGQAAKQIPILGSYLNLPILGISQLWRWAVALLLGKALFRLSYKKSHYAPGILNALLLTLSCAGQVYAVRLGLLDLLLEGSGLSELGPIVLTLPVKLGLLLVFAKVLRKAVVRFLRGPLCEAFAFMWLLFFVLWLVTAGPVSGLLGGVLEPVLPGCAHLASAIYFTALHLVFLLTCRFAPLE